MNDRRSRSTPSRPERMGALEVLPVFLRAAGRRIVVAGDSDGVAWKVELLRAAGADVELFAPQPGEALRALVAADARVVLRGRRWAPDDFRDALAVVADAASDEEAAELQTAARAAGVPLNVIDRADYCDFQFGSIVNRSPLVVGISTAGAAPVFGQAIRTRIEAILPSGLAAWAQAALEWRTEISRLALPFRSRRAFWERFSRLALDSSGRAPTQADRRALMQEAADERATAASERGKAVLVGAGPGAPELLTLRAVRALQSADVVLYDDLATSGALDLARREAEKIYVGKRGRKPSHVQTDITALLVELVAAGKQVVRLKGGDPMIFGRANEEIAALEGAGLEVEVVPGVTAASAAAAALKASLTDRALASRVQFVTAHSNEGRLPDDMDWRALADPRATTAIYMGAGVVQALAQRLMDEGLGADTPAAFVDRASYPDETIVRSTLASIAQEMARMALPGPGLLLIGAAPGVRRN